MEKNKFIPQIALPQLLSKFDGKTFVFMPDGSKKSFKFDRLPPYLLIAYKRFDENHFSVEKNSTIINFVLKGLDLRQFVFPIECDVDALNALKAKKLKKKLIKMGANKEFVEQIKEKKDLICEIEKRFPAKSRWKTK